MKDISKLALQACIMNSPLSLHSLENKLAEIQKMRENVSSERNSHIFFDFAMQILHSGILAETSMHTQKKIAEEEMK